jgi:hypothetical protein
LSSHGTCHRGRSAAGRECISRPPPRAAAPGPLHALICRQIAGLPPAAETSCGRMFRVWVRARVGSLVPAAAGPPRWSSTPALTCLPCPAYLLADGVSLHSVKGRDVGADNIEELAPQELAPAAPPGSGCAASAGLCAMRRSSCSLRHRGRKCAPPPGGAYPGAGSGSREAAGPPQGEAPTQQARSPSLASAQRGGRLARASKNWTPLIESRAALTSARRAAWCAPPSLGTPAAGASGRAAQIGTRT